MVADSSKFVVVKLMLAAVTAVRDLEWASIVSLLMVTAQPRVLNDSPRLRCILARMSASVVVLPTAVLLISPASAVVNLLTMPTSESASQNSILARAHVRSLRGFFFHFKYPELTSPVALICVYNCSTISASLSGTLPLLASF